ncbi:MAG TPA: bL21 family ribosomal protein, partial [bacterium]|nr:bL21 family ribosomal protein [bacterium]
MYAVIETGGKQYRIEQGTTVQVERLDAEPGTSVTLDQVVLL